MKYRVKYLSAESTTFQSVEQPDSYSAFKTAVEFMDMGRALECIVYIWAPDENEWVKVANVRKDQRKAVLPAVMPWSPAWGS